MIYTSKIMTILLLVTCVLFNACTDEQYQSTNEDLVNVTLNTQNSISTDVIAPESELRMIAFNSAGTLEFNKMKNELTGAELNTYTFQIRPGMYTLYVIANETSLMTKVLANVSSMPELDAVKLNNASGIETAKLPLVWKSVIYVKNDDINSKIGKIALTSNGPWNSFLKIEMERLASMLSVSVRKNNSKEDIIMDSLIISNIPSYSFITPMAYPSEAIYSSTSISWPSGKEVKSGEDVYTRLLLSNIFPEHISLSDNNQTMIQLYYKRNGLIEMANIPIPILKRNTQYQYLITITSLGIVVDQILVKPWSDANENVTIPGTEISFSRIDVPYSFSSISKIFFSTQNIAPENLALSTGLGVTPGADIGTKFDMSQTKIAYQYDSKTKQGSGILTIKRKIISVTPDTLSIYASGLKRTIVVAGMGIAGSNIYWNTAIQRLMFDDTPRVGQKAPHEAYQGLPFSWGGLQAMPGGSMNNGESVNSNYVWSSTGDIRTKAPLYVAPYTYMIKNKNFPFDPDNGIGDICIYMTRRGWAPQGKKWRIPASDELNKFPIVTQEGTYKPRYPGYQPGYPADGTGIVNAGLRLANYFLPQSGFFHKYGPGLGFNSVVNGNTMYSMQDYCKGQYDLIRKYEVSEGRISNSSVNVHYGVFVRCVEDDTPGEIVPLYVLSYDLSDQDVGTITVPTPSGMVLNQHADAGGSITLSAVQLTCGNGWEHIGWFIDGKRYPLGGILKNVSKDMTAVPDWDIPPI